MKKCFVIFIFAMLLSSCTLPVNDIAKSPDPSLIETPEPAVIARVFIPEQELVYRNEIAGYQITFPEHWRGYYVVTEYSDGDAIIGFYGRSKTGQNGGRHLTGRDGLDMFWISTTVPNRPDYPELTCKIGEVNGVDYFFDRGFARPPSQILFDILNSDDDWTIGSIERELGYKIDEEELRLVEQDWEMFLKIVQEDLWHAEDAIFPTFKVIE